jgi:hypothetical protein
VRVVLNDHDIAHLTGWDQNNPSDHFIENTDNGPWDLQMIEYPTKDQLNQAKYVITTTAKGNDHWYFTAMLKAEFDDGTIREWTFEGGDLNSKHSQGVTQEWRLADHIKP